MHFALEKHHHELAEKASNIAKTVVASHVDEHDRTYTLPSEALKAFHKERLLSLCVPKDSGGAGAGIVNGEDPLAFLIVIEELGRTDMSAAHCFQVHSHTCQLLSTAASKEQQKRYLGPVVERGALLSWTGSEFGRTARGQYNLISEAQPKNGGYLLNGVKNYGTLASVADWNVIAVNVAELPSPDNFLLVLVPKGAKGFEVDDAWWRPSGMRAAVSPKMTLKDLYVPREDVLNKPGYYPRSRLGSRWHLGFAANHLGAAQGLFDFTIEYLPKRGTTGNPHSLRAIGEMRMRIAAARDLVYHAAWLWKQQALKEAEEYSLLAKLYAISTAEWMAGETIRVTGSTALLETFPVSRMIRDIHMHSTHANLYNTAQLVGRSCLGLDYDSTQQQ